MRVYLGQDAAEEVMSPTGGDGSGGNGEELNPLGFEHAVKSGAHDGMHDIVRYAMLAGVATVVVRVAGGKSLGKALRKIV